MNIIIYTLLILIILYFLLRWFSNAALNKMSRGLRLLSILLLVIFAVLFAINSSLHSYLILSFTNTERVARDVGFYYMSNALGRLFGTILSGITYQVSGLWLCLATSGFMLLISGIGAKKLK